MPDKKLFDAFGGVSSKQWKQQIQYELKGADYNETLVWESPEGIKVKPFYHGDEGDTPVISGGNSEAFKICQDIFVHDLEKSIRRAKDSVERGAESLRFSISDKSVDIKKLVSEMPANIPLHFNLGFLNAAFIRSIDTIATEKKRIVFCNIDPIGQLAKDGNWFPGGDNFDLLDRLNSELKSVSLIGIHADLYQNAGTNIVQQIAYALAHANEYFNGTERKEPRAKISDRVSSEDQDEKKYDRASSINKVICIEVAIGSNYFFEIAKLRALRVLFRLIAKEYGHDSDCHIIARPTKRNKTIYDYNVNMLRTTTECMSAVLGGANTISNLPYDALYHKSNEFGERISRNQLLILKHESYFDKTNNAADGSYYIESLTQQLAEKALALFKEIEAAGGFLKQLMTGTIQRKISESADREQQLFDSGKEVLLGTNKHPNKNDSMSNDLELFPFVKVRPRKTLITPIIEKRLAQKMEQERLASETNTNFKE